jgi:hypothetical protein
VAAHALALPALCQVIALSREQEVTKQAELKTEEAKYQAQAAMAAQVGVGWGGGERGEGVCGSMGTGGGDRAG